MAVQPWPRRRRIVREQQIKIETATDISIPDVPASPSPAHSAHTGLLFTGAALALAVAIAVGIASVDANWWLRVMIAGPLFVLFRMFFVFVMRV